MNTKEYIESGTLDLYVAGILSVEEMRDVELKACQYSEIKTELEKIQVAMEQYAMKHTVVPRAEVKDKIMKVIKGKSMTVSDRKQMTIVREMPNEPLSLFRYLAAASVGLLILASTLAIYFGSQSRSFKKQILELTKQQSSTQNQLNDVKLALNQNAEQMAILTHSNTVRIDMKGTEKSPESLVLIYWNKETKTVLLDVKALPPTAPDKQYQLWFIDPAKGPVSAGVFDLKTGELLKMIDAAGPVAFAVTLEPKGGSAYPTKDEMFVIGNVPS